MTLQQRYAGLQTLLEACGDSGCHFLVLCSIIEEVNKKPVDLIDVIQRCKAKGWIADDFYVNDAIKILSFYTGKRWTRRTETHLPMLYERDFTEAMYYNERTGITHFRRRGFDTVDDSTTVREGRIKGYYIYTWSEV